MSQPNGVGPPELEVPAPPGPATTTTPLVDTAESNADGYVRGLHRRRAASQRLPRLHCGCCSDPHTAKHRPRPGGYQDAAEHLDAHGLTAAPTDLDALRVMYRDGGRARMLAERIATAWGLAG